MKTKALNIFGSALITVSAFFFVWTLSQAEEGVDEFVAQSLTVTAVLGKVEVLPRDALNWEEATVGMQLAEGDKIRTTEGAKAELVLKDGSSIKMKEETTLGIKTARQEKTSQESQYNLDFRVGEIMVELKKLKIGSSFQVETPTAVAAVRGTIYYMRTGTREVAGEEQPFVEIYVDSDDIVMFTNSVSGESCLVHQGESAIVFPDGTIDGPYPIPPAAQDAWKSGFDVKYDDSGKGKKGMRDKDEEGGDDDTEDDVDDTTDDQDDAQDDANQDRTGEQDVYSLAEVTIVSEEEEEGQKQEGTKILDSDGDGYSDGIDAFPFDPTEWFDTDGDGIGNNADQDDDNDEYTDPDEEDNETDPLDAASIPPDNDDDKVSDLNDPDDDNDNLSDFDEAGHQTDPFDVDTDDDGLTDGEEVNDYGTNPNVADTDNDNLSDGDEVAGNTPYNYVTIPTLADSDGDGVVDGPTSPADRFPLDYWEQKDSDEDVPDYWERSGQGVADSNLFMPWQLYPGDNEDAFPDENELSLAQAREIHGDGVHLDEFENPFYGWQFADNDGNQVNVRGYGSRYELRQASLNNLLAIENLRQDIIDDLADMVDDIYNRGYEAVKEKRFDLEVAKVMIDRWGNRVRVEEYVCRPTNDQVQVLALNLRTGGPNAGISSMDFRVEFDQSIVTTDLTSLPWEDYMDNPLAEEYKQEVAPESDADAQLIVYNRIGSDGVAANYDPRDSNYPIPQTFSLEVKNPYGDSVRVLEAYSNINAYPVEESKIWYQIETADSGQTYINDKLKQEVANSDYNNWGKDWNQQNKYTFLDTFTDGSWLMGLFYLIDNSGDAVSVEEDTQGIAQMNGIRDCINPDYNLEMIFFSSDFLGDAPGFPTNKKITQGYNEYDAYDEYLEAEYDNLRSIDVIGIPEIAVPYYHRQFPQVEAVEMR